MTKDEAIQRLRNNETLYMGDAWIGWSDHKGKYQHYEFGEYWHSEKLFDTVDELIDYVGDDEDDYKYYQTAEQEEEEAIDSLKAIWGEKYTWQDRLKEQAHDRIT